MCLVLPQVHRDQIRAHVERVYPQEGCGLLVGRDGSPRVVERVHPVTNRSPRGRDHRYLIDPEDFLAIEKHARFEGLEVVGVFHSHPDQSSEPSRLDQAEALSHYSYLIAGVRRGAMAELGCWRLESDGRFRAEPLQPTMVGPDSRATGS